MCSTGMVPESPSSNSTGIWLGSVVGVELSVMISNVSSHGKSCKMMGWVTLFLAILSVPLAVKWYLIVRLKPSLWEKIIQNQISWLIHIDFNNWDTSYILFGWWDIEGSGGIHQWWQIILIKSTDDKYSKSIYPLQNDMASSAWLYWPLTTVPG